jgi:hypothetical protein
LDPFFEADAINPSYSWDVLDEDQFRLEQFCQPGHLLVEPVDRCFRIPGTGVRVPLAGWPRNQDVRLADPWGNALEVAVINAPNVSF